MDVCSKDDFLLSYFQEQHGPADETTYEFFMRSYNKICNTIVSPKRQSYDLKNINDLNPTINSLYEVTEFNFLSGGNTLYGCCWKCLQKTKEENLSQNLVIVYFHTNLGCLANSLEIFPVAKSIGAHFMSFDLSGCGKSSGTLSGTIENDMLVFFEWVNCLIGNNAQIIIWSRGLSTAPTIKLLNMLALNSNPLLQRILCIVLDSPFTAIEDMIKTALERFQGVGFTLSKSILHFLINITMRSLSSKLNGFNLLSVRPIDEVGAIAKPVFIMSAMDDDYIPVDHGIQVASQWGKKLPHSKKSAVLSVQYSMFPGAHFGARPENVVLETEEFICRHLGRKSPTTKAAGVESKQATLYKRSQLCEASGYNASLVSLAEDITTDFGLDFCDITEVGDLSLEGAIAPPMDMKDPAPLNIALRNISNKSLSFSNLISASSISAAAFCTNGDTIEKIAGRQSASNPSNSCDNLSQKP